MTAKSNHYLIKYYPWESHGTQTGELKLIIHYKGEEVWNENLK